jgi:hypothetical protein
MKEFSWFSHPVGFAVLVAAALIWLAPTALVFADRLSDVEALEAG